MYYDLFTVEKSQDIRLQPSFWGKLVRFSTMISREECPFSSLAPSRSSKSAAVPVQLLNNFSNCLFYFGQFVVHFSNLKRNSRRMCCRVIRQWCTIGLFFALMVNGTIQRPLKNPTKDQICRGEYVTLFLSYVRIRLRLGRQKKSRSAVECSIFAVVGYDSSWHYFP